MTSSRSYKLTSGQKPADRIGSRIEYSHIVFAIFRAEVGRMGPVRMAWPAPRRHDCTAPALTEGVPKGIFPDFILVTGALQVADLVHEAQFSLGAIRPDNCKSLLFRGERRCGSAAITVAPADN